MKRILSIDGGGSRGLFALQILKKIEKALPPGETLNTFFHLIAGTSTGAIIAALIRRGLSLEKIERFYFEEIPNIFKGVITTRYRFSAKPIEKSLKDLVGAPPKEKVGTALWEPGQPFEDWALGSQKLLFPDGCSEPRYLMLVLMRADTLSPWVLTNHPDAKFNDTNLCDCNLQIPLWRLIKGSAAAPFYFPPQPVWLPRHPKPETKPYTKSHYFVDGGVSGYNNPAFIAYRVATLPQHPFQWEDGEKELLIVSVGTGDFDQGAKRKRPDKLHMTGAAKGAIDYLMSASAVEQDYLARVYGKCLLGPSTDTDGSRFAGGSIDSEIGDLTSPAPSDSPNFSYIRYQKVLSRDDLEKLRRSRTPFSFTTADIKGLNCFKTLGEEYAEEWFSPDHLLLNSGGNENGDDGGIGMNNEKLLTEVESAGSWFRAIKTAPVWAKQNTKLQIIKSREGNTVSQIGDFICRGQDGEIWTQGRDSFSTKYASTGDRDDFGFTKYAPVPSESRVLAAQVEHPFQVSNKAGTLSGKAGDYLVKSEEDADDMSPESVWVVNREIFDATYEKE